MCGAHLQGPSAYHRRPPPRPAPPLSASPHNTPAHHTPHNPTPLSFNPPPPSSAPSILLNPCLTLQAGRADLVAHAVGAEEGGGDAAVPVLQHRRLQLPPTPRHLPSPRPPADSAAKVGVRRHGLRVQVMTVES
eukprot:1208951-Rhodomonas_salina.1